MAWIPGGVDASADGIDGLASLGNVGGRDLRRVGGRALGAGLLGHSDGLVQRGKILLWGDGDVIATRDVLAILLVDLELSNVPVGRGKGARVVLDKGVAVAAALVCAGGVGAEDGAGPVAAEGCVEDEVVAGKVAVPVATGAGELSLWLAPVCGIGVGGEHVRGGRVAAVEPPDGDAGRGPLHCVLSAAVAVEAGPV